VDPFRPIKGKCMYWRESENDEDRHDPSVKDDDKRLACTCFIEGYVWTCTKGAILPDCPHRRSCRYYVRVW
jgi:hypothetical protein